MTLITAKYFRDRSETPPQFNTESGWKAISIGLRAIALGYFFLIVGATIGGLLLGMGLDRGPLAHLVRHSAQETRDSFLLIGILALGATALVSYLLVLAGQWLCLMYAPQRQNSKELMYVCFSLLLFGSLLSAAGVYLDGARLYAALHEGTAELDFKKPATLLVLSSVVLGLVSSLVFSQFLRSVASCFQDRARIRSVDLNLGFVGLLLGGSVGTWLCVSRLSFRSEFLPWLVGGWLLCFLWHLQLVSSVYRCVEEGLRRGVEVNGPWTRKDRASSPAIPRPSGLQRTVSRVKR
jgi:hypothetical protein